MVFATVRKWCVLLRNEALGTSSLLAVEGEAVQVSF